MGFELTPYSWTIKSLKTHKQTQITEALLDLSV